MAQRRAREADPPTALSELRQAVESGGAPRAALLKGEEPYFCERALETLVGAAAAAGAEVCKHDGDDPEFELMTLLDDLAGASLFAAARCVVVRGADGLAKKVGSSPSPFTRAALAFLESEKPGHLIVVGRKLRADHALAKAIRAAGGPLMNARKLWDTPPPWAPDPRKTELALWVGRRAREVGVRLSPDDAAYVAAATGNDLAAIDTQLEKLRQGGGEKLREVVGWSQGGTPWSVAADLVSGDLAHAVAGVESLFRAGFRSNRDGKTEVDPGTLSTLLFNALRSKTRQAFVAARAQALGKGLEEAAAEAGVKNGKLALDELRRHLELRDWQGWQRVYEDVCALEARGRRGTLIDANAFAHLALRWRETRGGRRMARGRA